MTPLSLKILVVDDEEFICALLSEILQTLGHEPAVFRDAAGAIAALRAACGQGRRFDLALLDLKLSGERDGAALLAELRKLDPELKALAVSGHSEESLDAAAGFQGFLMKPFKIQTLADAIVAATAQNPAGN